MFCIAEQGMIHIIDNVNGVRATTIFYLFDINFFRAKSS